MDHIILNLYQVFEVKSDKIASRPTKNHLQRNKLAYMQVTMKR